MGLPSLSRSRPNSLRVVRLVASLFSLLEQLAVVKLSEAQVASLPRTLYDSQEVRTRLLILLTCIGALAHSGPVPACQLDDLVRGCISDSDDAPNLAPLAGFQITSPIGDDTPDDIVHDALVHHSLGNVQQAPVSLHNDHAAHCPAPWADLRPLAFCSIACDQHRLLPVHPLYPPSPPSLQDLPLLI